MLFYGCLSLHLTKNQQMIATIDTRDQIIIQDYAPKKRATSSVRRSIPDADAEVAAALVTRPDKIIRIIGNTIQERYYSDLAEVELSDESNLKEMILKVTPCEGFHANVEYTLSIKFQDEEGWPFIHIYSNIFDKITSAQYKNNTGYRGAADHRGICIHQFSHLSFRKNFKKLCYNKWEVYVRSLITTFNYFQLIEPSQTKDGKNKRITGIDSNFKEILARL